MSHLASSRVAGSLPAFGAPAPANLQPAPVFNFPSPVPCDASSLFKFKAPPVENTSKPKPPATHQINLEKYLDSNVFADVEFVVQSERYSLTRTIRAHKQFLAMRNDVFGTMFFGSLPEKDKVCITDLHPSGFYGLLKYLYSGICEPGSFEEAIYIREAADKYLVPELVAVCSKYIKANMSPDKVCPLLDCLATTDIDSIDKAALQLIKNDGLSVLNSESFADSLESTVECILKVTRSVPESCIFVALRRWAEEKCRKSLSTGETPLDLQAVLRPFLPKLRFLALTPQEYVKGPGSWNVLEDQEDFAILRNIIIRGSVPLPSWVCTDDTARGQLLFQATPFEASDTKTPLTKKENDSVADSNEKPK